ncbi:MAG: phosphoribosylglycinamide formyltransferase [Carbonactinosporaceae bacterium]
MPPARERPVRAGQVRLVVLVSGTGSNLQALLDASRDPRYGARVVAAGADRDAIPALDRARRAGVASFVVRVTDFADRAAWDGGLAAAVAAHQPDLVVLAGFMKIVGSTFLECFPHRVINTHPALLPSFPGRHGVRDALAYGAKVTGCTIHFVAAEVDSGPPIAQAAVPVLVADDEQSLHRRIKSVERALLVETVGRLAREGYRVEGRRVQVGT